MLLVSSLKADIPSGLAKGVCVPPAQGFRAVPDICHSSRNSRTYSKLPLTELGVDPRLQHRRPVPEESMTK